MSLSTFARRLFCRHRNLRFVRNIYGDEINLSGKRSVWACQSCGASVLRPDLHPLPSRIPPAPPTPPRRVYADAAPAPSRPAAYTSSDYPTATTLGLSSHHSEAPEPTRFVSGGGGDFGGGGATSSWGDSSSSSCDSSSYSSSDSGSGSSDSSSSSCSSD